NFDLGTDGKLAYSIDGGTVSYQTTSDPVSFTDLSEAEHTVDLELVDMSENPLSPAVTASVTFTVNLNPEITPIYDIQYTEDASGDSPYNGDEVTVKGVVTANFNPSTYGSGYYIQQGQGAWNGLFIDDESNSPDMGDSVRITGTVNESYNMTQLESIQNFMTIDIGGVIPDPEIVTTNEAATMEDYESVLVKVEDAECTSEQDQYGKWTVDDGTGELFLKDNGAFDWSDEVVGEYYNITGVILYSYQEYRLNYRIEEDIEVADAISDNFADGLSIYPNPATDFINFNNIETIDNIEVYNVSGQLMDTYPVNGNSLKLDVSDYSNAVYFVKFVSDKFSKTIRFEKQ
ncbi:MAG: T9SS type A sorting domain-containing protein, partial [Bacteroidales bacterium]